MLRLFKHVVNQTISRAITGTWPLRWFGPATLSLKGANTFSGGTFVKAGQLSVGAGASIGTGPVTNGGIIQFDCSSSQSQWSLAQTVNSLNGTTTGSASQAVLAAYAPGTSSTTTAGSITLSGNVTQYALAGYGAAAFNIAAGSTHVSEVGVGIGNSYGAPGYLAVGAATLTVDSYITSGGISGAGANGGAVQATFNSGALVKATGFYANNATYGGNSSITVNAGATFLTGSANIGVRTYNLAVYLNGGTVGCWNASTTMNANNSCTLGTGTTSTIAANGYTYTANTVITGSGQLVTTGPGTVQINGNNTYSGGTTVNSGTLKAGNVNAFGTGTITVNAGATLAKGGFAVANPIVNNGGTVTP